MNRNHFQQLADVRMDEAAVLLAEGKYDKPEAQELIAAITDAAHGVLPWIRQRW